MEHLSLKSIAKINLGLHITGKREDGYHLMETLFVPVPELYDELVLKAGGGGAPVCSVSMPGFGEQVPLEQNLVFKAWKALRDRFPGQVGSLDVEVRKQIPAGAGLGGGSGNAATVLLGANELFGLGLDREELAAMGEELGADVPFFVYGVPLYATGIGTDFEPFELNLEGHRLEVFALPFHSSTPEAYRSLDWSRIGKRPPLRESLGRGIGAWRESVFNDLQPGVCARIPQIQEKIDELYKMGAAYAAMTGSGSAVFGLFPE